MNGKRNVAVTSDAVRSRKLNSVRLTTQNKTPRYPQYHFFGTDAILNSCDSDSGRGWYVANDSLATTCESSSRVGLDQKRSVGKPLAVLPSGLQLLRDPWG